MGYRMGLKVTRTMNQIDRTEQAEHWVARNRGQLSRIAREVVPEVTPQFVHLVLRGRRKSGDGRVEKMLRKVGAPV